MKTKLYIATIIASISIALAGPKDKNYKPWKDDKKHSTPVARVDVSNPQGPAAKNAKKWEETETRTVVVKSNKSNLKGPQRKNQKPWND